MVKEPAIHRTPVKIAMTPSTQRQPTVSPTNPPTMGPMVGPRKGALEKTLMPSPRSLAGNMSAMTPPAFVKGDEPNAPARNRRMMSVEIFFEPAAPALQAVRAAYVPTKRICLPYNSDIGAQNRGPIANPSTNTAMPRVATSVLQWNASTTCTIEPEYAVDTKATAKVAKATMNVIDHFFH